MRTLATAIPNKEYQHFGCLKQIKLEARLVNNQIEYYETRPDPDNESQSLSVKISDSTVMELFNTMYSHSERPFLARENKEFYIVINRNRPRFQKEFHLLKNPRLK